MHQYGTSPTGILNPPPVVLPDRQLFARRARRLRELAERSPELGDFLGFMALLVQAQEAVLQDRQPSWQPAPDAFSLALEHGMPPLQGQALLRDLDWQGDLEALLANLELRIAARQRPVLEELAALSVTERQRLAEQLLAQEPGAPEVRGLLPLVGAALQVAWVRLALGLPQPPQRHGDASRVLCPTCAAPPLASIVHADRDRDNVRYLHCSLCATEWHLERSKCSCCNTSAQVRYLALEDDAGKTPLAAQAETCDSCDSYLKLVSKSFNLGAEPLADDLASLPLDFALAEEGRYARSGFNPLFIAGE
ncbi:formate dehydrogenase accessory protein FdhE [Pseudomonas oryzihabitans]|uniref:formate dehydrogenase accessory protein FdhE n=1 Tax=Pseudomonas oryzihabitans TaxID=47885 RepID=UPI0018D78E9C|nr:formate dehydrogenase accessory protein FdhE [Pseudomonas oryzihabitans]MBH3331780.1 formate dehydrogenase accessory protein FdhE [Pseudomonas oryzihabitans]